MGWDGWDVMGWSVHFFFGPVLSPSTPATGYQAPPPIFIDGWMGDGWVMDGWMDGWVGLLFFCFTYFSKTTLYIILIVFGPPRRRFEVSSVKKLVKKNKNKFFKKFRTKRVYFVKKSKRNSLVF